MITKFIKYFTSSQKRWITYNHICTWPFRLDRIVIIVKSQDGVHLEDVIQRAQHRLGRLAEAVLAQPLDVADPDGGLGELVGVCVDLDAMQLGRVGRLGRHEARQAEIGGGDRYLLPEIEQLAQADVQEIAAAAGWIQHLDLAEFGGETLQQGGQLVHGLGVLAAVGVLGFGGQLLGLLF